MTQDQLKDTLNKLGVVKCNSEVLAPCRLCQPDEQNPDRYKLRISAGTSFPVLLFCRKCSIPKPYTNEEKKYNKQVVYRNVVEAGIDTALIFNKLEESYIRELWSSIPFLNQEVAQHGQVRASDTLLNHCYSHLLDHLTLSDRHKEWLTKRGVDPEWALKIGYRTSPTPTTSWKLAQRIYQDYGQSICDNVPGLTEDRWLTREGALLIPCRDECGRIGAIKQRLMDNGHARMRLLSGNGPKAKQMLHYPLGTCVKQDTYLWITEGERKADVLYTYTSSVVGIPGVGSIGQVYPIALKASKVVLALDKDMAGLKAMHAITQYLQDKCEVYVAKWDSKYKKIDDAIRDGVQIQVVGVKHVVSLKSQIRAKSSHPLSEQGIIEQLANKGWVGRDSIVAYPTTVSKLIREGKLEMQKTPNGQLVRIRC